MRKILHLDLDAFFCAVEEQRDPSLIGSPFAVGGHPDKRGVVASCSYAARQFGVRSAMPMARALQLCPRLRIVPARHSIYSDVSEQVMQRLRNLTPLIEQISIDEAFLDVTDLRDRGEEIARHLQSVIQSELDLPCSLGVATNKLIAKIANDVGKSRVSGISPPNAITVVPPGEEAAFLAPLPTQFLWGVGPKTSARLKELNVYTIGDLAAFPVSELVNIFGKIGTEISQHARGIDDRPVITSYEPKSFSQETTFTHDINDEKRLIRVLRVLAEGVGKQLRHEGLSARTVKLKLRWADFTTLTRQTTLVNPTNLDEEIFRAAQYLFSKVWINNKPVRLLGIGASNFCLPVRQLSLWEDPNDGSGEKNLRLQSAIDKIRERQGDRSIQHGSDVDRDL